jgi:MFS family permease
MLKITGSTSQMANVYAVGLVFSLGTSLILGFLADRFNKKYILILSDLVCAISLIIASIFIRGNRGDIAYIFVVQIILSSVSFIFSTSLGALIPQIFNRDELGKINSTKSILTNTASIAGPIIGIWLLEGFGIKMVLLINGISFFISALVEMTIKYKFVYKGHIKREKEHYIKEIRDILKGNTEIMIILIFVLVINFIATPIFSILLPKIVSSGDTNLEGIFGFLSSLLAVGIITSSYLIGKIINKYSTLSLIQQGVGVIILSFLSLIFITDLKIALIGFSFIFGFSLSFINIPIDTYFQQNIEEKHLGKFFSILDFSAQILAPLSMLIMGYSLEYIDYKYINIMSLILLIIVFLSLNRIKSTR